MDSTISVRRAAATDAVDVSALVQRYVATGALLPRSATFVAEHAADFLVAAYGGRVIGCVHLQDYSPSLGEVRSLVVDPAWQGRGVGSALVDMVEGLARKRQYATLFAVSNSDAFFRARGYEPREIPELDRERSEVSKFKGVYAKDLR